MDPNIEHIKSRDSSKLSLWRFMAISSSAMAFQMAFAVEFAFVSPMLAELGVSKDIISVIWLAGPISGFIVQPIVGVYSDRSESKLGRRRPFIFWGGLFMLVGLGILATAQQLTGNLSNGGIGITVSVIVFGLWILNIAINVLQGPSRSLVNDLSPKDQLFEGQSVVTLMMSFANLLGNLAGAVKLTSYFPFFPSDNYAIFSIGIIVIFISVIPTLLFAKEWKHIRTPNQNSVASQSQFSKIIGALKGMNSAQLKAASVLFMCWFAYFPFQIFMTDFMGSAVYKGDADAKTGTPERELYEKGVRMGALSFALLSLVGMPYSYIQDRIIKTIGMKTTWIITLIIGSISLCYPAINPDNKTLVFIFFAIIGIPFVSMNSIPYSLIKVYENWSGKPKADEDTGLMVGVLNAFIVIAQTISNFFLGTILLKIVGNKVRYSIFAGGVFMFVAALTVGILDSPSNIKVSNVEKTALINDEDDDGIMDF